MNTTYHDPYASYANRPKCIGRSTYLARGLCVMVGAFVASCVMSASDHLPHGLGLLMVLAGAGLLALSFVALFALVLVPRIRDTGLPHAWAWSLLLFVHPVSSLFLLALLLVPTDAFAKRRYAF